ncbi:hypothetical protein BH10BAC4_BH10BAC4_11530 [soil metagenome]
MTRLSLTILFLAIMTGVFSQKLVKFNYSACLKDLVNDSSKVQEIKSVGTTTTIRLRTYAPCNGNLGGGFEFSKNTINLKYWTKPIIIKHKNGKHTELLEIADCNCLFDFTYQIEGLASIDKKAIKVNGLTLKDIDSRNIWKEIRVELSDTIR